jgi:bifunctional enzyme CysN/CysC/sulfate adenylyltransferase subunit 1
VQWVNRPNNPRDPALHDFRGLSGQIAAGIVRKGQPVLVLPSGVKTRVKEIWTYDRSLDEAFCPQSVTLVLEDDLDVSRGDMLIGPDFLPGMNSDVRARVCWMNPKPLQRGRKCFLKHTSSTVQAVVTGIDNRLDIRTFESEPEPPELAMNDLGEIRIRTSKPLVYDGYGSSRLTGSFILIEQGTNMTIAAGMLQPPTELVKPDYTDFAI